jgi:transcriptional regulator with XRE-family HTH domain
LGAYPKDRCTRLDAAALGFSGPAGKRRACAARRWPSANISVTWYTWLEQGPGGAPSADVLDRIARALMLTDVEREHLFLLGLGRRPEVRYRATEGVSPRLQRLPDALEFSPAIIKTATWDIVAWNRAGAAC